MRHLRFAASTVLVLCLALPLGSSGCDDCSLRIDTDTLPAGQVGQQYRLELQSHCGGDFWFLEDGGLPPGIALDQDDGVLFGTPTLAGVYTFTLGLVDDDTFDQAFKGFAFTISPAT